MEGFKDVTWIEHPQHLAKIKQMLEHPAKDKFTAVVDNKEYSKKIEAMARSMMYRVNTYEHEGRYYIDMYKTPKLEEYHKIRPPSFGNSVVVITMATFGRGDDQLGSTLMRSFLFNLGQGGNLPKGVLFVNAGVKLTVEGSPVVDVIRELSQKGVEVLSSITCLDYYGLKDKLVVGGTANMTVMVDKMIRGANTIVI
ncbi:MAG TPA: sulfurtransferase-like selenium metabolism protein YedF [Clostridiales bacterium]|nr:sulfurtransferase-like selenium metabolism protein YedF [Clostridiales bacterium]